MRIQAFLISLENKVRTWLDEAEVVPKHEIRVDDLPWPLIILLYKSLLQQKNLKSIRTKSSQFFATTMSNQENGFSHSSDGSENS